MKLRFDNNCQFYENNWVKWDCSQDKIELKIFEDSNPLSDESFIDKNVIKNKEDTLKKVEDEGNND